MRYSTLLTTTLASVALAKDINVTVGVKEGNQNIFTPDSITAEQGDIVTFWFWPKNHSVAQASFTEPCSAMDNGFWSGYIPTADNVNPAMTMFMVNVTNASQPLWFYCTQGQHCQSGMVGVINPPQQGNRTLDAFKEAAAQAGENETPNSAAGTTGNGMLMNGTGSMGGQNAASSLQVSSLAFSGVLGMLAYMLL